MSSTAKRERPKSPNYGCSFCGKSMRDVQRLIAGPGGVFICNECIALCNEIIGEEDAALAGSGESKRAKVDAHVEAAMATEEGRAQLSGAQDEDTSKPINLATMNSNDAVIQIGTNHGNDHLFLSPEQAAVFLGVHTQTIRGYIRSGKLRAYRLAGERIIRIDRADLLALLQPLSPEDDV